MSIRRREWQSEAARSVCETTGLQDAAAGIAKLAADLVYESGLARPGHNLSALASLQDARIEECVMRESGQIIPLAEGFLIRINTADAPTRKNFSTCHEIGHTLVPSYWDDPQVKINTATGIFEDEDEEEYLCDVAASELLIPHHEFAPLIERNGGGIEMLAWLAEDFRASLEATAIKLASCGVIDVGVIVWEPSLKPTQQRCIENSGLFAPEDLPSVPLELRVKFSCYNGREPLFFPKDKSVEKGSRIDQIFHNGGTAWGNQLLLTNKGERIFYTESQAFDVRKNEAWQRKIVTLVFPSQHGPHEDKICHDDD